MENPLLSIGYCSAAAISRKLSSPGVSEFSFESMLGKFIIPKRSGGKDMILLDSETR
ncbi:hypothetical protein [uncultured Propionivibrio sp.]|uniref:hypothetical protein n=1 Tax=uncultured Propionivibrio sp. TaxID=426737 RepID=UPI003748C517